MAMTASWNNFGPGGPSLLPSYGAQAQSVMNGPSGAACRCTFCVPVPCSCSECLRGGGYTRYHPHPAHPTSQHGSHSNHQLTPPTSSPSGFVGPVSASSSPSSGVISATNAGSLPSLPFYSANMTSWTSGGVLPFLPSGNPQPPLPTDPCSSDEALSPPHQDDPYEDIMDAKEVSRLQQDIVKAWKQKKRSSFEAKTRTHDKYRQVYSAQQRFELEKEFHYQRYISSARKTELSRILQLSERQIKIWFQNRRAKERRTKKNAQKIHSTEDEILDSPKMSQFVKVKDSPSPINEENS